MRSLFLTLVLAILPTGLAGQVVVQDQSLAPVVSELLEIPEVQALAERVSVPLVVGTEVSSGHYIANRKEFTFEEHHGGATLFFKDKGKLVGMLILVRSGMPHSATVDAVIHELWGHGLPVAAGEMELCSDPAKGQQYAESCVAKRENQIRHKMGLVDRTEYALRF